jgi:probable F420-dependent oxidoreductase
MRNRRAAVLDRIMQIALYGLHRGSSAEPAVMARRARRAEELGFEALWVGDHIALPAGGSDPPEQPRIEAVVALAHLAALTTRIGLGVGVIVLPQRQPVLLAKQLASIDVLSGGRLTVGIGVGYVEAELSALGASLADRAARTDEYLAAMHALWDAPTPSFAGRFVSFDGVLQRPQPIQRPHPPIIIGGQSAATFRRVARSGNGWYGWELTPEQAAESIAAIGAAGPRPAALGEVEVSITPPGPIDLDQVRRYADAGVHRLVVQPSTMDGTEIDDLIDTVGETIIARL